MSPFEKTNRIKLRKSGPDEFFGLLPFTLHLLPFSFVNLALKQLLLAFYLSPFAFCLLPSSKKYC